MVLPWNNIFKQSFETGTIIHCFSYPDKTTNKNNEIYAGIAAVNALLDLNIHPDQLIFESYGTGSRVAEAVNNEFAKRSITFTHLDFNNAPLKPLSVRYLCAALDSKVNINEHHINELSKLFVSEFQQNKQINDDNFSFNFINSLLETNTKFLKENLKIKNPNLFRNRIDLVDDLEER